MTAKRKPKVSTAPAATTLRVLSALGRKDFRSFLELAFRVVRPGTEFLPARYLDALAYQLERFAAGETKRLIVNIPPRYLKSFCCSVALPAWLLGLDPTLKIVCVSYSNELSRTHANDFRALVKSKWYGQIFPAARFGTIKDTELEIWASKRGYRLATSLEGTLTGRGGDILIIDDPMKAEDAASPLALEKIKSWYRTTASTRLDNKVTGKVLVVMQRLHVDDLCGYLGSTGSWNVVAYPAIADEEAVYETGGAEPWVRTVDELLHPEREPLEAIEEARATLGSAQFNAQYQQRPVPLDGNMIMRTWFDTCAAVPSRSPGDVVIQSWDTAYKEGPQNDYSVCVTALRRGRTYYILDVYRARLNGADLKRAVERLDRQYMPDHVLVEDVGSGSTIISLLQDGIGVHPIPVKAVGNKQQRVYNVQPVLEGKYVKLPADAAWREEFLDELAAFPNVRHDDRVDALTQLVSWAEMRRIHRHCNLGPPISVGGSGSRSFDEQLLSMQAGLRRDSNPATATDWANSPGYSGGTPPGLPNH